MSYILSAQGRKALDQQFANTARAFGQTPGNPSAGQHYTVTPSVAQTMYEKVVEDGNPFLSRINVLPVSELKGEKIGMSLTNRVASRTDTSGTGERVPKHLVSLANKLFELFPTEFDVALKYALIDSWAKFPDFAARYMKLVRKAIGNDMLQTGWSGTSAATTTNLATNPLLQDLNKGWLQLIREFNSGSQYLLGGTKGVAGAVTLGETNEAIGGFANLDLLAQAAREMLPIQHRNNPDLVMITGSNVLSYQQETFYKTSGNTPTEKAVLNGEITRAYDAMPSFYAPFFPASSLLVTTLDNLSIYFQDSSVRRTQKDKPEKNEVQDFNSVNMGYVVEDEELTAFIENITFK
jgi:P2 family phage major capsid protein